MRRIIFCLLVVAIMLNVSVSFALHDEDKGPEKFGRYEFKEQDINAATKACDDDGKPGPEFVPTVLDNQKAFEKGKIGMRLSGAENAQYDNIVVATPGFNIFPVEPRGKLAVMWGDLKRK